MTSHQVDDQDRPHADDDTVVLDPVSAATDAADATAPVEFATVFDLDYGERRLALVVPQQRTGSAPAPRVARPQPAPQRARRVSAPAHVRLTRRGRLVALTVFLVAALGTLLTVGGFSAVATRDAGTPPSVRVVTVQPGDTLYGIAADVAAPGKIRETVHQIQELNSLSSSSLSEGQKLAVPRG